MKTYTRGNKPFLLLTNQNRVRSRAAWPAAILRDRNGLSFLSFAPDWGRGRTIETQRKNLAAMDWNNFSQLRNFHRN